MIHFLPGVPPEVEGAIRPLLERYAFALPYWLRALNVEFDREWTESSAQISVWEEYRKASLKLSAGFLQYDAQGRDWLVAHEIAHLYTTAAASAARGALNALPGDDAVRRHIGNQACECVERATEALAQMLRDTASIRIPVL